MLGLGSGVGGVSGLARIGVQHWFCVEGGFRDDLGFQGWFGCVFGLGFVLESLSADLGGVLQIVMSHFRPCGSKMKNAKQDSRIGRIGNPKIRIRGLMLATLRNEFARFA